MGSTSLLTPESQSAGMQPAQTNITGFLDVTGAANLETGYNFGEILPAIDVTRMYNEREEAINQRFGIDFRQTVTDEIKTQYPDIGAEGLASEYAKLADAKIMEGRATDPDKWNDIQTNEQIRHEIVRRGQVSKENLDVVANASAGNFSRYGGQLLGGIAGSFQDPINLATLPFGMSAGVSTLRAIGGEFLLNAAIELAEQPKIAAWQKEMGYKYGFAEGAADVVTAGIGGGALTAIMRGARFGAEKLTTTSTHVLNKVASSPNVPARAREAATYLGRAAHLDEQPHPSIADRAVKGETRADDAMTEHRRNIAETARAFDEGRKPDLTETPARTRLSEEEIANRHVPAASQFEPGAFVKQRHADYSPVPPQVMRIIEGMNEEVQKSTPGSLLMMDNELSSGQTALGVKGNSPEWYRAWNNTATEQNKNRAKVKNKTLGEVGKPLPPSAGILTKEKLQQVVDKLRERKPLGKAEAEIARGLYAEAQTIRERNVQDMLSARATREDARRDADPNSPQNVSDRVALEQERFNKAQNAEAAKWDAEGHAERIHEELLAAGVSPEDAAVYREVVATTLRSFLDRYGWASPEFRQAAMDYIDRVVVEQRIIATEAKMLKLEREIHTLAEDSPRRAEILTELDALGERRMQELGLNTPPPARNTPANTPVVNEQSAIPGTEAISDKQLAERKMEGRKQATVNQKRPDEGLFSEGQKQQDLLQEGKGSIAFTKDRTVISLFENADRSTFLHEWGHFYFNMALELSNHPDAPYSLRSDVNTLRTWVGANSYADKLGTTGSSKFTVEQEEQIARGFEQYLRTGEPPVEGLRSLFSRVREWLMEIYRSVEKLNVKISDDVKGVFDRWFAAEEEFEANFEQVRSLYDPMPMRDMEDATERAITEGIDDQWRTEFSAMLRDNPDMEIPVRMGDDGYEAMSLADIDAQLRENDSLLQAITTCGLGA